MNERANSELYNRILSSFQSVAQGSEKVDFPVLQPGLVRGTEQVEAMMPGRRYFLPPPEQRRLLEGALQEIVIPKPIRYESKDVPAPTLVEGLEVKPGPAVPLANLVLFLHADTTTLVSKDARKRVTEKAGEVLDAFSDMRDEVLQRGVSHVGAKVFFKILTVARVDIEQLAFDRGLDPRRIRTITPREIVGLRAMLEPNFNRAVQRVAQLPPTLAREEITTMRAGTNSFSYDNLAWMKEKLQVFVPSRDGIPIPYFPPAVVIEVTQNYDPKVESLNGHKVK